jgi:hypothetical protein
MNRFLFLSDKYKLRQFDNHQIYSVKEKLDNILIKLLKEYKNIKKINKSINKLFKILNKYKFELRNIIKTLYSIDPYILNLKVFILHQNYKADKLITKSINNLINNPLYSYPMKYLLQINYESSYWLSNQLRAIFVSLIYVLEKLRDTIIKKNNRLKTLYEIIPKKINEDIFKIISSFII